MASNGSPLEGAEIIGLVLLALGITQTFLYARVLRPTSKHPAPDQALRMAWGVIAFVDVALISIVRAIRPQQELGTFLLYFFPLLVGAEYLRMRAVAALLGIAIPFGLWWTAAPKSFSIVFFLWRCTYLLVTGIVALVLTRLQHAENHKLEDWAGQLAKLQLQLEQRHDELIALYDFRRQIGDLYDESQIINLTIAKIADLTTSRGGGVWRFRPGENDLEPLPVAGSSGAVNSDLDRLRAVAFRCLTSSRVERDEFLLATPIKNRSTFFALLFAKIANEPEELKNAETFLASLADDAGTAIARAFAVKAFREISLKTAELQQDDERIEEILRELTGQLEFDFAVISMVDPYQKRVQHVRGRNVPAGWMRRAKFPINSEGIIPAVVESGRTEVIQGWDKRFDPEIYKRYGHEDLIRVWVPIKAGTQVIGVMQAGRDRRSGSLSPAVVARVEEYAEKNFDLMARSRPIVLLEMISRHARNIVGAHGASVHVFGADDAQEAGDGETSREFVIAFGRELEALLLQESAEQYWICCPITAGKQGVRSAAMFRLILDEDQSGVLCVHFTFPHEFSQAEVELLRSFAGLVSVSLLNSHLLTKLSATTELAWTVSSLQRVLESLASTVNLPVLLRQLTDRMLAMFDADSVVLHRFEQARLRFFSEPVVSGRFEKPDLVKGPFTQEALPWTILETGTIFAGQDQIRQWGQGVGVMDRFVTRERIRKCAGLLLKTREGGESVGVLFINYRVKNDDPRMTTKDEFTAEQKEAMRALASSAAIAIHTAAVRELSRAIRQAEHDALVEVDRFILDNYTNLKLDEVLTRILRSAGTISGAKAGAIMKFDSDRRVLRPLVQFGDPFSRLPDEQELRAGIVGLAGAERQPFLIDDVRSEQWRDQYVPWTDDTSSELAVPIADGDRLIGVINLEHPDIGHFTPEHQVLVQTLALQGVIASRSDQLLTGDVRSLQAFSRVAAKIREGPSDSVKVLRLILTGVTAGDGLGFSRAMLFETNEGSGSIKVKLALGPVDGDDADRKWNKLKVVTLERLLDEIVESEPELDSLELRVKIKGSIPLADIAGLSDAVRGKERVVPERQGGPLRKLYRQLTGGESDFGFVPLDVPGGGFSGFILVDRAFQRHPNIPDRELPMLSAFAELAAIAIQRELIRVRLSSGEIEVSETTLIAEVAHELDRKVSAIRAGMSELRRATDVYLVAFPEYVKLRDDIEEAMAKASGTVHRLRWHDRPVGQLQTVDLRELLLLLRSWPEWRDDCPVDIDLPATNLECSLNRESFTDVLLEIIRNGREAALAGTRRNKQVTVRLTSGNGRAHIAIRDTGDGIPEDIKSRIWTAYFSTKGHGRGLGLSMVRRIVQGHEGQLEVNDQPGGGTEFVLTIPIRITVP